MRPARFSSRGLFGGIKFLLSPGDKIGMLVFLHVTSRVNDSQMSEIITRRFSIDLR